MPTDYVNIPGEHLDLETNPSDEIMENTVLSNDDNEGRITMKLHS
jgi:hypothetical protein